MKLPLLLSAASCLALVFLAVSPAQSEETEKKVVKLNDITIDLTQLINLGKSIAGDLLDSYSPVPLEKIVDFGVKLFDFIDQRREGTRKVNQIFEQLSEINKKMNDVEQVAIQKGREVMHALSKRYEQKEVQELYNILDSINSDYENNFVRCFLNTDKCLVKSKESFATAYTTFYNNQARKRLEDVRRLIVPPNVISGQKIERLFDIMIEHYKMQQELSYDCGGKRAFNQQIYQLYNFIVATLIRGYVMVRMSYIYQYREELKQDQTPIGWQGEWESILNIFKSDTLAISIAAQAALKRAAKDIRPCDPKKWAEGENYGRLLHFIDGYIANDIVLNDAHNCGRKCDFSNTTHHQYGDFAPQITCTGAIRDCEVTDLNAVWVSKEHNHRRYNDVGRTKWEDGRKITLETFGLDDYDAETTLYDDKQIRPVDKNGFLNINKCYMCKCYCDDYKNPETVRGINHAWVRPETENAVVTGVRLRIVHKTLTIQIQEAVLVNGTIDHSTVRWVPVNEQALLNGKDTELLNYDARSIMFDDLELAPGSVVTGVSFQRVSFHHALRIAGKPLDVNGNVSEEPETVVKMRELPRDEIVLEEAAIPTLAPIGTNKVLSRSGKTFLYFQTTGWKKDAAQTVIPFFDFQDVSFNPVSALGGVGLYYKGAPNYGGFIGLRAMAPDYSNVISPDAIEKKFDELLENTKKQAPVNYVPHFDD